VECKAATDKVTIALQKSQVDQVSIHTLGGFASSLEIVLNPPPPAQMFPRCRPSCRSRWSRCAARRT
jgi:hypothetical protein